MKLPMLSLFALGFLVLAGCESASSGRQSVTGPGLPPVVDSGPDLTPASKQAYKAELKARHLYGIAIIRVRISAEGKVLRAQPLEGPKPVLDALVAMAPSWTLTPAMKDGKGIDYTCGLELGIDDPKKATPSNPFTDWREKLRSDPWAGPYLAIHPDVSSQMIHSPQPPIYRYAPGSPRMNPKEGVLLAYVVEADGTVRQVRVLENTGGPNEARDAIEMVTQQVYRPAMKAGEPVPQLLMIRMPFSPEYYGAAAR